MALKMKDLLSPPSNPMEIGSDEDWRKIESKLGIEFPDDYKQIIDLYGTGAIWGMIRIWNPFAKNPYLNLQTKMNETLEIMKQVKTYSAKDYPYNLYPAPHGLIPFADTVNGDVIFWEMVGEPHEWKIVIAINFGPKHETHNMGIDQLISEVIEGKKNDSILSTLITSDGFVQVPQPE